jgi:hypothetical protein
MPETKAFLIGGFAQLSPALPDTTILPDDAALIGVPGSRLA